ncbi:MAG: ubiquinol-cytochrome c reductase iron-sulfur subunit [Vicinamibacteria bacterium]
MRFETQDRWRRETRDELVYVRRKDGELEAVTAVCPHSGCLVKPEAAGFACPCHRSLFDADGRPLAGPSRRPLDRLELKLERGRALVRYRRFRPGSAKSEPLDA